MQIVINIPEEKYDAIKNNYDTFPAEMKEWGLEEIKNGAPQQSCEDIAKAFQLGLAFGFGEKHDEMNKVIDEIKKVITPRQNIQEVLDKIRADIENTEIIGHIRDVECFSAGIDVALNVINKYKAESEDK